MLLNKILYECFFSLSIIIILYHDVISRTVSLSSLILWMVGLIFLIIVLKENSKKNTGKSYSIIFDLILLSIATIIVLLFFGSQKYHFHYDESITAYTSFMLPSLSKLDWFGVVPKEGEWVNQFPILFHILQKPFLLLNQSEFMIRISTWPYTIGTIIFLYLLTRELFPRRYVILSSLFFIFLAPQMYLGSLGLHFHSSTFFTIVTLYGFIKLFLYKEYKYSVLLGLSMSASYMTYTSSYVVGPLILLFIIIICIKKNNFQLLRLYLKSFLIFLFTLFPLLIYSIKVNNFFIQRVNQVNIFNGSWRSPDEIIAGYTSLLKLLASYLNQSSLSLFMPNIGGNGEYWFGHLAFFEQIGAALFVLGILFSLYIAFKNKSLPIVFILTSFFIMFISSLVLTVHPPAFHRFSIVYPYVGIIMSQGLCAINLLVYRLWKNKMVINFLTVGIFIIFAISNINHSLNMINIDSAIKPLDSIVVSEYIRKQVKPSTPIYIAAFPANAFGKELFFRTGNLYPIFTTYFEYLPFKNGRKVLILHQPSEQSVSSVFNHFPKAIEISSLKLQNYAVFLLQ